MVDEALQRSAELQKIRTLRSACFLVPCSERQCALLLRCFQLRVARGPEEMFQRDGFRVFSLVRSALVLLLVLLQAGALGARRLRGGRTERRASPPPRARGAAESFALDFTPVEENMDSLMTQVKNLAHALYGCSAHSLDHDMKLHLLENTSTTCNDGTPAG